MIMKKILLIVLLALIGFQALFLLDFFRVRAVEYDMYLTVENISGFNTDTDAVYFGAIQPTGGGTKLIDFTNGPSRVYVSIVLSGELAGWVYVSDNNFYMNPFEQKQIKVTVAVPLGAEYRDYTGKIRFLLKE